jgi:hypothetical protein
MGFVSSTGFGPGGGVVFAANKFLTDKSAGTATSEVEKTCKKERLEILFAIT